MLSCIHLFGEYQDADQCVRYLRSSLDVLLTLDLPRSPPSLHSYESGDLTKLLFKIRIFARMSPHSKVHAVNMHRKAGLIVGMCGDGGNVCVRCVCALARARVCVCVCASVSFSHVFFFSQLIRFLSLAAYPKSRSLPSKLGFYQKLVSG